MNESREPDGWLDEELAERLLDGRPDQAPADGRGDSVTAGAERHAADLARLLQAARTPVAGRPEDERAALQAFRAAQAARPRGVAARLRPHTTRSARALAGGVAAVVALSGVAIAAQAGALPHPFRSGNSPHPRPPASTTTTGHASPAPHRPGQDPAGGGHGRSAPPSPAHTPPTAHLPGSASGKDPGVKGLCEAHDQAVAQGRQMESSGAARLAAAAGGTAKVDAYCAALLGGAKDSHGNAKSTPAPHPSHTPAPSGSPSAPPGQGNGHK
jgi:hypothetical protein